ncbi:MAG: c-type cytochrome [Bacteroidota bacterium]|nr:c-type cytochrome [Bacteroidota bacterium]
MKNLQSTQKMKNAGLLVSAFLLTCVFTLATQKCNAQSAKPWIAPASASQVKNPFAGDANAAKEGKKLYVTYCTPCHGNTGKGDGIAAAALNPKPANHTSEAVQNEPDGSLYWKMTEGRGPMISYKQLLKDNQRWQLVCYIKTLGKKK